MGLIDFADIGYSFASSFFYVWDLLNRPLLPSIQNFPNTPSALTNALVKLVEFIISITNPNVTPLGLILYFIGTGFILFYAITLVKWVLDIIT